MSKKNSIIIILLVVTLLIGGLLFFYFRTTSTNGTTQTQDTSIPDTSNPFGSNVTDKPIATSTVTVDQNQVSIKNIAKLIQLYRNPTSGATFLTNKHTLRFVDRANSNVYEYIPESQSGEATRVTNTTIPKIQEAVWSGSGDSLVLRYLDNDTDNIISFGAKIKLAATSSGAVGEITGTFLPSNIKYLAVNPKGDKIFGLLNKTDGSGTLGVMYSYDTVSKRQIFDSPLSQLNISWPKEDLITFTTKPSYKDYGYLYFFNTQTQVLSRIFGNVVGMSTVTNSAGSLVAYSETQGSSFSLDIYDVKNKQSKGYKITTLAEKCVWGNTNTSILYCAVPQAIPVDLYPDAWYMGLESFSDSIWMIDISSGSTKLIYQIGLNENANIDAINLKISTDDQYLSFSNKTDLSLWLLKLGN